MSSSLYPSSSDLLSSVLAGTGSVLSAVGLSSTAVVSLSSQPSNGLKLSVVGLASLLQAWDWV